MTRTRFGGAGPEEIAVRMSADCACFAVEVLLVVPQGQGLRAQTYTVVADRAAARVGQGVGVVSFGSSRPELYAAPGTLTVTEAGGGRVRAEFRLGATVAGGGPTGAVTVAGRLGATVTDR